MRKVSEVVSHRQYTDMQRRTTGTWEDQCNSEEESSYLQYLDANNLYGWEMNQTLPTGDFKWVERYREVYFKEDC